MHARILGFRGLCLSDNDFCKALEINPMFLGGPDSEDFMKRMKKWFYYGFANCALLSVQKIAGAGQKLPPDWPTVMNRVVEQDHRNPYSKRAEPMHGKLGI